MFSRLCVWRKGETPRHKYSLGQRPVLSAWKHAPFSEGQKKPKSPQNGGSNAFFATRRLDLEQACMARSACRRVAALQENFTPKCVPSHLILRMKNSGSEESLSTTPYARGWLYTILRASFPPGCTSVHHLVLASPQHPTFERPPLIYHPCQCRASAAAPGRRIRTYAARPCVVLRV